MWGQHDEWNHDLVAMLVAEWLCVEDVLVARSVSSQWKRGISERFPDAVPRRLCFKCHNPTCRFVTHTRALLQLGVWTDDPDGEWSCEMAPPLFTLSPLRPASCCVCLSLQVLWQAYGEIYFSLLRAITGCDRHERWLIRKILPVSFAPTRHSLCPIATVPLYVQCCLVARAQHSG